MHDLDRSFRATGSIIGDLASLAGVSNRRRYSKFVVSFGRLGFPENNGELQFQARRLKTCHYGGRELILSADGRKNVEAMLHRKSGARNFRPQGKCSGKPGIAISQMNNLNAYAIRRRCFRRYTLLLLVPSDHDTPRYLVLLHIRSNSRPRSANSIETLKITVMVPS